VAEEEELFVVQVTIICPGEAAADRMYERMDTLTDGMTEGPDGDVLGVSLRSCPADDMEG
jgi:hypothetical protein